MNEVGGDNKAMSDNIVVREWRWCQSKEQRTCDEVCFYNLNTGKCIKTKKSCKVKPPPMSEEAKMRLRSYDNPQKSKLAVSEISSLLLKVKDQGAKKVAAMLYKESEESNPNDRVVLRNVREGTVRGWIKRGNIPVKYQEAVSSL